MKRILALLLLSATPLFAENLSFSVVGMDCALCGLPIVKALQSVDGVRNPKVDWKTKTATVEIPAGFDKEKIRTSLSDAGFAAVFPGEQRKEIQPLPADVVKTLDIVTLTDGRRADIAKLVVPEKITIVDFYADWCGPCHVLENRLEHLMQGRKDIALRRVNIGKWDNDASKQATREFHVEALPYIRLYDARGNFVTSVSGWMWDVVLAAIEKSGRK